jgi:hypothetical protein
MSIKRVQFLRDINRNGSGGSGAWDLAPEPPSGRLGQRSPDPSLFFPGQPIAHAPGRLLLNAAIDHPLDINGPVSEEGAAPTGLE